MDRDDAGFLRRWSRRKAAARAGGGAARESASAVAGHGGAPSVPQAAVNGAQAATPLPPIESLQGLASDYRAFFQGGVDPDVQRAAVKQLFRDPHFNEMDGLDVYIDDYGIADPIPAEMLAELLHTRGVLPVEVEAENEIVLDADPDAAAAAASTPEAIDAPSETAVATSVVADGEVAQHVCGESGRSVGQASSETAAGTGAAADDASGEGRR